MIAFLIAKKAGLFQRSQLMRNIISGSGAKPEQGLYTAIVAGLFTSTCGGSLVQIAGPTGAFIVILSAITAKFGILMVLQPLVVHLVEYLKVYLIFKYQKCRFLS